jgi:transposase
MFQPNVPGRKLNSQENGAIVTLRNRQISFMDIAEEMRCSVNTVKKWVRCFEETGDVTRKVESGRFKKRLPKMLLFSCKSQQSP